MKTTSPDASTVTSTVMPSPLPVVDVWRSPRWTAVSVNVTVPFVVSASPPSGLSSGSSKVTVSPTR